MIQPIVGILNQRPQKGIAQSRLTAADLDTMLPVGNFQLHLHGKLASHAATAHDGYGHGVEGEKGRHFRRRVGISVAAGHGRRKGNAKHHQKGRQEEGGQ